MRFLLSVFFVLTLATLASAQTSTTTLTPAPASADSAQGENKSSLNEVLGNKKFAEDREITDAKMKADAGSLSKYSLSFNFSYYGPTLGDLEAKDQPNPDGSVGTYETSLGGALSARYRIDSKQSINTGTGMKAVHPFHGMERFDTNNPFLSYNVVSRVGSLQMRNSPGVSYITVPNYKKIGEYGALNYDFSMVYNLGTSRVAIGLDTSLGYYLYNREYVKSDGKANRYSLSLYPTLKYNATDKLNFNTSTSIGFWNPRSRPDQYAMLNKTVSQRVGVGYAITRDIYLSPYLNFYPANASLDNTTVNFSTVFSLL